jgi:MFS family permease
MKVVFVLCIVALLGQLGLSAALKKSQLTPALASASNSDEEIVKLAGSRSIRVVSDAAKSDTLKGFSAVLGGAIAHLALGTLYTWGNLMSYSPKSLRFYDGGDHAGQPDALTVIPLVLISQCITMPLGSLITQRIGAPNSMRIGGLLAAAGVFLASYATRLRLFMVLYGMLFGFGAGIAYTAPMAAGWKWLPDKKGLVSGIILTGFGAGGFVFNIIGTK